MVPKKPYVLMDLSKLNLNRFNMYYDNHELRYLEKRLRKESPKKRSKSPTRVSIKKGLVNSEFSDAIKTLSNVGYSR
jgi:hypothetical protein